MIIALWAALAMVAQDILAVCLVQAEARDKAALSAGLDSAMWLASIATTTISVTALQGHQVPVKTVVVVAVTLANMVGSFAGVKIGQRFIKGRPVMCACANCVVKM
jgi:hypothetical protein